MKKFLVLLLSLFAMNLQAFASDYSNYCAAAVDFLLNALAIPDDFLAKNSITFNATIKPDGTIKNVKVYIFQPHSSSVRLPDWEKKISELKFPAHNSPGVSPGKPIVISQRLVREGTRETMRSYEFVGSLRSAIKAGFKFHRSLYLSAKVSYVVDRDANLVSYHIIQGSGYDAFDNAVEKHLEKRQKEKLLYLPLTYKGDIFKDTVVFTSK